MTVTPTIEARSPGDTGKVRLDSLSLDGRTKQAKRIKALAETYADALGGWAALGKIKQQEIERAATLCVVAEIAQAQFLSGSDLVTADDLIRCTNAADRAIRRLGIRPAEPKPMGLDEYLRQKAEAEAAR